MIKNANFKTSIMVNNEDKWGELLRPFRVIRDAVHGDIWITQFETEIIDDEVFQRLRYIKQLGPAYLVYPSAHHTRFEHSIGTLFVAQKIIDSVQRNYTNRKIILGPVLDILEKKNLYPFGLDNRDIVLTRTVALLHDVAHIPYGHTLEKEGNLFQTQWADKRRTDYIFEKCGLREKIVSYLSGMINEEEAKNFVEELKKILQALEGVNPKTGRLIEGENPEDEAIGNLPRPYIGDIVGNTICADLIDYVVRDSYFTGLKLSSETRILETFSIIGSSREKARLTLLLVRKGRLRHDYLSEAIQFLRERYHLAEKVYYHRVKSALSVMVIGTVYAYFEAMKKRVKEQELMEQLMQMGDESLIYKLAQDAEQRLKSPDQLDQYTVQNLYIVQKLAREFKSRHLYKPVYMVLARKDGRDKVVLDDLIKYTKPDKRYEFERYLEDLLSVAPGSVPPGSILMYVTKKDLGKAANVRCLWVDGEIKTLEQIGSEKELIRQELENLRNKYLELWRIYVLTDKKMPEKYREYIAAFCKYKLFPINDLEYAGFPKVAPKNEAEIYLDLYHTKDPLTPEQRQAFVERIERIRTLNPQFSEVGVPKSVLEKEFKNFLKEQREGLKQL